MLKTRYIKINLLPMEGDRYFLTAYSQGMKQLEPSAWKHLLFFRHQESYFGTMLEIENDGIILNGWQLVTLFAKEQFNHFIEWDWDDLSHVSMSAAPAIHEAILEKDWLPDFAVWEQDHFRWALPVRVQHEFGPDFWKQAIETGKENPALEADSEVDSTNSLLVHTYIQEWFHSALDAYLTQNQEMKSLFGERLALLQNQQLSSQALARFFNEDSWLQWIGVKDDPTPFTVGLQLEEPADADADWSLSVVLRSKKRPDDLYLPNDAPKNWKPYFEKVDLEQMRWVALFPWLAGASGIENRLSEAQAWEFLTEASETLVALGVEILLPSWWQAMKNANLKVKARVKGSSSHRPSFVGLQAVLDYDWRFSMNGVDLSEDEFQQLVEEKRRLVYVRGRWIKLDPQFIRQIQELMKKADKQGLHVRDLLEQELIPESPESEDDLENPKAFAKIQIELNRQWKQMMKQLSEITEIPDEPVPQTLHGELRPYQTQGMSWLLFLRRCGFGACLADDMGLGKTVQLLSYLLSVKERDETGPALIVCPTSVLGNWQKEIERFAPSLLVYLHYGSSRLKGEDFTSKVSDVDIVLTSYGLTHLDFEEFASLTWSSIAIDEAQNIKNAGTKQSRAVRKLKGKHHIALTGTPMENRLTELWSIFDFINHGYLGSLGQFQKRFVLPIEKDDEKEKIEQLQSLIRPFLLRRTKKDKEVALNLPDKLEQKEYCPLTAEQASLYEQLVRDTFDQIESLSGFERKGLILQMLSRLKQLCNHPALYLKEAEPKQLLERSTKLEKLSELVDAVLEQDESCLIFTQYIQMGEIIRSHLKKKYKLDVPFLNGSVPKQQRDVMIERFQNREFPVFLLSLKAGGTGLNLTAANHVVHYDRWWNPAVENQATDRAYRIGQDRFVHVHKLISTGTLEEKIDAMLEKKQSLNDQIIQSENWITELTTHELQDLLKLS
jgi:SNF2 family DNA or RNA helicase